MKYPPVNLVDEHLAHAEFDHFETEIFRHMKNLSQLAEALVAIKNGKLYEPDYPSFVVYIERRFGLGPNIAAAIMTRAGRVIRNN